jgi:hypothetical protein
MHIDSIDHTLADDADPHGMGNLTDLSVQAIPARWIETLGIVEPINDPALGENDRSGHHRSCDRGDTDLVDAGDDADFATQEFPFGGDQSPEPRLLTLTNEESGAIPFPEPTNPGPGVGQQEANGSPSNGPTTFQFRSDFRDAEIGKPAVESAHALGRAGPGT